MGKNHAIPVFMNEEGIVCFVVKNKQFKRKYIQKEHRRLKIKPSEFVDVDS